MDQAVTAPPDAPRLLVVATGARHYREYLLRAIAGRYRVHLLLGAPPGWERGYCTGATVLPGWAETLDPTEFVAAARAQHRVEPFAGVLTWDEARVLQSAEVAAALGLPGGSPDAVLACRDKYRTRAALAAAGVPQPRFELVADLAQALAAAGRIGYPVVLKPRALAASLGVVRADDPAQLTARFPFARDATVPGAWRYEADLLVERYLPEPEISVDAAVHRGTVLPWCVARKELGFAPYFEETGHLVDAADPLRADPALGAVLTAAHAALGVTDGMTHTELKLTADGPQVIEVNARLGGGLIPYLGWRATGVDPGLAAAAVACGQPPELAGDRRLVGAVRFFYPPAEDTAIGAVTFAPDLLADPIDLVIPLAGAGQVLSPPPRGTAFDRIALATAVAAEAASCRAALDRAGAALTVHPPVPGAPAEVPA